MYQQTSIHTFWDTTAGEIYNRQKITKLKKIILKWKGQYIDLDMNFKNKEEIIQILKKRLM